MKRLIGFCIWCVRLVGWAISRLWKPDSNRGSVSNDDPK